VSAVVVCSNPIKIAGNSIESSIFFDCHNNNINNNGSIQFSTSLPKRKIKQNQMKIKEDGE
jgi:hypothetical protein